jgi:plasmid stability protein
MSQILIRNLPEETVESLKRQAKRNSRSLEAEARDILRREATKAERREDFLQFAAQIRAANGPQRTDSVELIRADRER